MLRTMSISIWRVLCPTTAAREREEEQRIQEARRLEDEETLRYRWQPKPAAAPTISDLSDRLEMLNAYLRVLRTNHGARLQKFHTRAEETRAEHGLVLRKIAMFPEEEGLRERESEVRSRLEELEYVMRAAIAGFLEQEEELKLQISEVWVEIGKVRGRAEKERWGTAGRGLRRAERPPIS